MKFDSIYDVITLLILLKKDVVLKKQTFISPISIDLGAKSTGVYFAHYPDGSSIKDIEKSGKIYQLEKNSYTLLMRDRTATRHQRRGHDRRQMVKRIFKLIWEQHFKLQWNKDVQQTISFLLNRRGFTFLTEEYNTEILNQIPKCVYDVLPEELKKDVKRNGQEGCYNFNIALKEWAEQESVLEQKYESINKKPKAVRKKLFVIERTKSLKKYCEEYEKKTSQIDKNNKSKNGLSELPKWVLEEWISKGVQGLPDETRNINNIVEYLDNNNSQTAIRILNSIEKIYPNLDQEEKTLKNCIWNFTSETFSLEKEIDKGNFILSDDNKKGYLNYQRTHLNHLAFAIFKINNELESGGRHRSKYFEEVKNVLEYKSHTHGYLKRFCKQVQNSKNKNINSLYKLICHLSNFELKPLRKYFNDIKHRTNDYWDEARLAEIFEHWILKEWRINLEKDRGKSKGKKGDYNKLKEQWDQTVKDKTGLISFWLKTDPFLTIPPYQDSNNRRPPRCQSLLLNCDFLDRQYPKWEEWIEDLKQLRCVKDYLSDYEQELKSLKSSGLSKNYQNKGNKNSNTTNGQKSFSYFQDNGDKIINDQNVQNVQNVQKSLKSSYQLSDKYLKARILQFIFDRVKKDDPLQLNEIYSHAKKYRQNQYIPQKRVKAQEKLENIIPKNKLPNHLTTGRNYDDESLFPEKSFLHLVCRYYKFRQKAKAGRMFIHPKYRYLNGRGYEKTNKFDDKDCLLTYCNHKPRQKRYQVLKDLASLLQISPQQLKAFLTKSILLNVQSISYSQDMWNDKIYKWVTNISGLKSRCEKSAKEQKDRRGSLKSDVQRVYGLIYHKTKNRKLIGKNHKEEIKNIIKKSQVKEANKLLDVCEKAKEISLKFTKQIYNESRQDKWEESLENNPVSAIYFLAQMNNIIFKERQGNAKTCMMCSMDNAQRMQTSNNIYAKAQKLPAISTRIIDGTVMRMARILCASIAKDKWKKIKSSLEKEHKVCIPIITESNRFEFEPTLKTLKGRKLSDKDKKYQKSNPLNDKESRIKWASLEICPYEDKVVNVSKGGEIDHIIPQSSQWGTLNDEANLIWASREGNDRKDKKEFSLQDLNKEYKAKQFGQSKTDQDIENWIIEQIGDEKGEEFKFGKYLSFINLNPDERKAFRHALFLKGHPLREKVIKAIDHRTRTLVNGTQRYFAEILANNLHKKVLAYNVENNNKIDIRNLSFDYFGVESTSNSLGEGIHDLRKSYEEIKHNQIFEKYKKDDNTQQSYSHLIDAQLAFCIVADAHKDQGSFKISIPDDVSLWPVNGSKGENTMFKAIHVKPEDMKEEYLDRRLPTPRTSNMNHRPLFNQNAVAVHFLKLMEIKKGDHTKYLYGFLHLRKLKECLKNDNWLVEISTKYKDYAKEVKPNDICAVRTLYQKGHVLNNFGYKTQPKIIKISKNIEIILYHINKSKVLEWLIQHFNTKTDPQKWDEENCNTFKQLGKILYFTKKVNVLKEDKKYVFNYQKDDNFKCKGLINPQLRYAWKDLENYINKNIDKDINERVKHYFLSNKESQNQITVHQKTRKVFSLPIKSEKGFLINKKNWIGKDIFYFRPASNDFSQSVLCTEDMSERLSNIYRRNNVVLFDSVEKLKKLLRPIPVQKELVIDPNKFYEAKIPEEFKAYIYKIENQRTDSTRPKFKFYFKNSPKMNFQIFKSFIEAYPFRKLQDLNSQNKTAYLKLDDLQEIENLNNKIESFHEKIQKDKENKSKKNQVYKEVIQVLNIMNDYWIQSQNTSLLEYQAKHKFTLKKS